MPTEFRASANGHKSVTKPTPREAAIGFFEANPKARKCDIMEGTVEYTNGMAFFSMRFGRASEGDWPKSWRGVTRKTVETLP